MSQGFESPSLLQDRAGAATATNLANPQFSRGHAPRQPSQWRANQRKQPLDTGEAPIRVPREGPDRDRQGKGERSDSAQEKKHSNDLQKSQRPPLHDDSHIISAKSSSHTLEAPAIALRGRGFAIPCRDDLSRNPPQQGQNHRVNGRRRDRAVEEAVGFVGVVDLRAEQVATPGG